MYNVTTNNVWDVFVLYSFINAPGLSLSPLPTVTSGVIVQLLTAEKLNDAFGKNRTGEGRAEWCTPLLQLSYDIKNNLKAPQVPLVVSLWHKGAFNRSFPCMEANYAYAKKYP